jgi:hypothetical protein
VLVVRGTKKFLDCVGSPEAEPPASTTVLGDWYATVLPWKPQVALLVNERSLLPVLTLLAPVRTLLSRLPESVELVLSLHGLSESFASTEVEAMRQTRLAKTGNRSVVGMLNEFAFLADQWREPTGNLVGLSLRLSDVPCGPLVRTHTYPRQAVAAAVDEWILAH